MEWNSLVIFYIEREREMGVMAVNNINFNLDKPLCANLSSTANSSR